MRMKVSRAWLISIPLSLIICFMAGCAAKTAPVWGDPQTGLILQYRMTEGETMKYASSGETHQTAEVMGQTIETDISSTLSFSMESKGQNDTGHQLTITIDDMSLEIQSVQGELAADMEPVIGKSFDMTLSVLGKELELIGAEAIEYDLGPEGSRNISASFQDVFPNLADRPVKVGDSWPDESTITENTGNGEAVIHFTGVSTLAGFETIDGMECAKITTEGTGTIEGRGEQQGIELNTRGEIKGTTTWFFAYREGVFIKQVTEGTVEGTIDVPSQGMQIPFSRESTAEMHFVK
jgi:hypothetical protein